MSSVPYTSPARAAGCFARPRFLACASRCALASSSLPCCGAAAQKNQASSLAAKTPCSIHAATHTRLCALGSPGPVALPPLFANPQAASPLESLTQAQRQPSQPKARTPAPAPGTLFLLGRSTSALVARARAQPSAQRVQPPAQEQEATSFSRSVVLGQSGVVWPRRGGGCAQPRQPGRAREEAAAVARPCQRLGVACC